MLKAARERAERKGLSFNITTKDIEIPDRCPLLGLKLEVGNYKQRDSSPSLDRILPHLGYVPGNVWVISNRANRIKTDASVAEIRAVLLGLEAELTRRGVL